MLKPPWTPPPPPLPFFLLSLYLLGLILALLTIIMLLLLATPPTCIVWNIPPSIFAISFPLSIYLPFLSSISYLNCVKYSLAAPVASLPICLPSLFILLSKMLLFYGGGFLVPRLSMAYLILRALGATRLRVLMVVSGWRGGGGGGACLVGRRWESRVELKREVSKFSDWWVGVSVCGGGCWTKTLEGRSDMLGGFWLLKAWWQS